MKKSVFLTFGLACMVAISLAFTKDEPRFKNLKVLPKNISKEQLDSVMHHFTGSLGVRCSFCHVHVDSTDKWDFASDENKHKLTAREMMRMMNKINDKYFNVTGKININSKLLVTCYTCHHGSEEPSTIPPHREGPQRPASDSSKSSQATDSTRHK